MSDTIPEGLEELPPQEQRDWFQAHDAGPLLHATWNRYYVGSVLHRGLCCSSCIEDQNEGYDPIDEEVCCCEALRDRGEQ